MNKTDDDSRFSGHRSVDSVARKEITEQRVFAICGTAPNLVARVEISHHYRDAFGFEVRLNLLAQEWADVLELQVAGSVALLAAGFEQILPGTLRDGRWAPLRFTDRFVVYGRESRLEIVYDYAGGLIQYRGRAETFLLRRLRVTDDAVSLPAGGHVDDVVSATLNYAERRWLPESDGRLVSRVVRRQRIPGERPDEADRRYRAELVPFELRVEPQAGGRASALLDLTRFSSWAREDEPARIVFGADRRPEAITASLILGTSLAIRFGAPPVAAS